MIVLVAERGTEAWRAAHRGHICASDAKGFMARLGSKRREEVVQRLVLDFEGHELHTDEHPEPWTERHEEDLRAAVAAYRKKTGRDVEVPGFVTHDKYTWCGASPHGLIGSGGMLHFRVRQTLRGWYGRTAISGAELARVQVSLFVCDRAWCDVVDYWSGGGLAPDRLRELRVELDPAWLSANVFPRLVGLWDDVRARLRERSPPPTDASPGASVSGRGFD